MMRGKFHNMDCMEGLKKYPDNHFDLAIVDPPYGIFSEKKSAAFNWVKSGTGGTWATKYGKKTKEWDVAPTDEYFTELDRVSIDRIIWGANHFGIKTDNFVVWRKLTISESFSMGMCEFASVSVKGNPKVFEKQPQDTTRFHPTQKPITLYRWLLQNYAKPGDKILDTHVGSGSSLIACELEGFDCVGYELDEDYYKAATERIEREVSQTTLFSAPEVKPQEQPGLFNDQP